MLDADAIEAALQSLTEEAAGNQRSIEQQIAAARIATTQRDLAVFRLERDFPYAIRDLAANAGARGLSDSGFLGQALRRAEEGRQDARTDIDLALLSRLTGTATGANVSNAGLDALSSGILEALR